MEKLQKYVKEQMEVVYGHRTYDKPRYMDEHERKLSFNLCWEEFKEFMMGLGYEWIEDKDTQMGYWKDNGHGAQDLEALADGKADLDVVSNGVMLRAGIDMEPIHDEVHRSNMSKEGGEKREDGKLIKPDTYSPANIADEIKRQMEI